MTEEVWKDIPGYEGRYQVSNLGRVRSLPRTSVQKSKAGNLHEHRIPGRILKPRKKACGHTQVHINGKNRAVHRLVALTFLGPAPAGMEVCHNNSRPDDNRLSNLRYDTRHANRVDMIFVGNQGRQKLKTTDVLNIRSQLTEGRSVRSIAESYGVSYTCVWGIKKGVTFRCLS